MSRLSGSPTLQFASPTAWNTMSAGVTESEDFTVPGAKVGDFVLFSIEATAAELEEVTFSAQVSAANTVTVAAHPDTGTTGTVAAAILRIKVVPFDVI
jgi:hypothetical protein